MEVSRNERRKLRSRSGCQTCRSRKVKCDERPGGCDNCARLSLPCGSGRQVKPLNAKRTFRSCTACRSAKVKCSGDRPVCRGCQNKKAQCVYDDASEPRWKRLMSRDGNEESSSVTETVEVDSPPRDEAISDLPEWLISSELPDPDKIQLLVNEYFCNIHPLRCYAFIHQPSFLQRLDSGLARAPHRHALLHIMCALGAQFYALEHQPSRSTLQVGAEWARKAQSLILAELDRVTIDNLMATVLLHDHALRMGNFANAFILSALTTRMTQALQINLEYNTDILCTESTGLSLTIKESRRRLMWSCYVLDALVGSGVDQLTLMDEKHIKIQLPCNDRNFQQKIPSITEVLEPGEVLRFIPLELKPEHAGRNMGIMGYFIRHVAIRKRVVQYIKHLDIAKVPWAADSEFAVLDKECRTWYESLPASLQFTQEAIYMRKTSSQLGALCVLHCAHYSTICDLYRLGAPALYKLRAAFDFPPEQRDFLRHLQEILFDAAKQIAIIITESAKHGTRMLADSWLPSITYDSCRIMVYHLTQILDPSEQSKALMQETLSHLKNNIVALKKMQSLNAIAESLCSAATTMVERSGIESEIVRQNNIIPDDPYSSADESTHSSPGTPPQSAPDYVLNPLSIYRMARKSVPERHAPEKNTPSIHIQNRSGDLGRTPRTDTQDNAVSVDQANLDELQTLFMSDLGWAWQPADTAVGSGIEAGLLPWAGGIHSQGESWLPTFPFDR
ncbi:hypothetical protein AWENTII_008858 [Aspergillus wentii]